MKKNFLSGFSALLLMLIMFGSCKKNNTESTPAANNNSTPKHGLGAVLNQKAYLATQVADLDQIRTKLIQMGYLSKLSVNSTKSLPASIILNHPAIGDQGQTGTCVSWSSGYALMGTLNNEFPIANVSNPRSGWYVYQKDHSANNDCDTDDGMYVTGGLDILQNYGVPTANLDASLGSPCQAPSSSVNASAATDKNVSSYAAISTVADIKNALSMNLPVEMGFNVYDSFETAFDNGTVYKKTSGSLLGGHAICIIGYSDAKNAVLIQNSWGTSGGDAQNPGCMWLDYSVFTQSKLGIELYVAQPK
ncbi:C1 family peptidase [Mucilaginibacter lappiensis]|uniref:C1A family cysteine protease n=1 Tax=Mucilaginibacter lappiensis TaxID=354630 RepID=A0A841JE17_9SPHI|nr:C1 family peptidase [Mucilaginibacter lappiensis]MBB6129147.1 C1A family cysteine protease [Mucilaginibacter lappiensis]